MSIDRRTFIKSTAALSAVGFFPSIIIPKAKTSLGVALVGLGYYSTDLLAPALQLTKKCHLAGIVTGSPEKIPVWQKKYGFIDVNVYNYSNMDQIANNDNIDVIYIVLPPAMHAEYAIKAANTGKQVWVEKPMEVSAEKCEAMIDAAKKNKVGLSIGYRLQHDPNTQELMKLGRTRPYGNIKKVSAEAGYTDNRTTHWKQNKALGGGVMLDMGVYPLNALRYTFQSEPIRVVSANLYTNRPEIYKEVEEIGEFTLEFPGGGIGYGMATFGKGINQLSAVCERGSYELNPFQAYGGLNGKTSDGKIINIPLQNQQAKQMDDNSTSIMQKTKLLAPGEEGWRDIRIVEAIKECARKGESVKL